MPSFRILDGLRWGGRDGTDRPTRPPPLQRDVGQQVMAGDDPQQLQHLPEIGFVAPALPLQSQQKVSPAPDHAPLVIVDNIHKEEGEDPDVPVGQVGSYDIEHAVQAVEAVLPVGLLLRPGLLAAPLQGGHLGRAAGPCGGHLASCTNPKSGLLEKETKNYSELVKGEESSKIRHFLDRHQILDGHPYSSRSGYLEDLPPPLTSSSCPVSALLRFPSLTLIPDYPRLPPPPLRP